jgi:hypothetical protein
MWKAINLLQFIVYTGYWNLSPPSNVQIFIDQVGFFTRFGWIPKDKILNFLHFNSNNTQSKWSRFLLVIVAAFVFVACLLATITFVVRRWQLSHKAAEYAEWLNGLLFWNGFIRVGLQVYLDFAVSIGMMYTM